MPYEEHPLFVDPKGINIRLFRYMDFTKFTSLLLNKSLFFPSVKFLQTIDPWEGTYPKKELAYRLQEDQYLGKVSKRKVNFEYIKNKAGMWTKAYDHQSDINFVNCWHYNTTESSAMWRLYLKSNEGIAIQTDFKNLKNSFEVYSEKVYIGRVRYLNYETDIFFDPDEFPNYHANMFTPFIHKRKQYEHEKEYRAIIPIEKVKFGLFNVTTKGVLVPTDLKNLIQSIIVAPGSPDWFLKLVENSIKDIGLNIEVVRSIVDDIPYTFELEPYKNLK